MDSFDRGIHPATIGMSLAADAAELGRLLALTDPHRYPGLAAVEEAAVSADSDLAQQLRAAIEASGLTAYAIAQASGVDDAVVYRFLAGQRDVTLAVASRLAAALGMRFTKPKRKGLTMTACEPIALVAKRVEEVNPKQITHKKPLAK
jgi:transcriptional regulator with XRE-family HTH domain